MKTDLVPFEGTNETRLEKIDPGVAAAEASAKARISSAYIVAMKNPRDEDQARAKLLAACRRTEFANTVEYSKPIGKIRIRGKSIRFAEEAARAWKNILTSTYVVHEDDSRRRITIIVTDLEANINHSQEIVVMKTVERRNPSEDREVLGERINSEGQKVYIVKATDEEVQTKENSQISKILRNEVLRMIPSDMQEEAVAEARKTMALKDKQDPEGAKKQVLDSFQSIGIWPKDLEAYLKHKLDNLSPKEIEDLREVYGAIKSGESTWRDYMEENRESGAGMAGSSGPGEEKAPELTEEEKAKVKAFDGAVPKDINKELFDEFLKDSATRMKKSLDQLKILALADWNNFWAGFNRFMSKKKPAEEGRTMVKETGKAAEKKDNKPNNAAPGQASDDNVVMVVCPERTDTQMTETFCGMQCFKSQECKPYQNLLATRRK